MNRTSLTQRAAATALGLAALLAASAAQARSDVYFSIGVQPQPVYVQPQPVYVQPQPVYVQPQPVYVQPRPVYGQVQPVFVPAPHGYNHNSRRGAWGDRDGDGIPNAHDRWDNRQQGRHAQRSGAWGDADRDGVPNRHDSRPNNPYRY